MNKPFISTRQRRFQERKHAYLVRILISIVALIECLILLSITTYSWIESSSSLIISTGKDGLGIRDPETGEMVTMAVANNLNYQVEVSASSSGSVNLKQDDMYEDDGGFFRTVRYFNYARASSPDGKTFYFKKPNNTYRLGDTADYNTSYTYLDFEINNTTGGPKDFYFSSANIFSIMDGNTEVRYSNMTANQQKIVNALRFSIDQEKGDGTVVPVKIFSLNGNTANAVTSTAPGGAPTAVPSSAVIGSNYIYTGEETDEPVFTVDSGSSKSDKVSIRIWFEMKDTELGSGLDELIAATNFKIDLEFKSDGVDYDQIYFDDYAFSQKADKLGEFVTEEDSSYSMYLHVYNAQEKIYINYPMTKVRNSESAATRWVVSVPIPYVVEERDSSGDLVTGHDYLTNTQNEKFTGAYFFYGTAGAVTNTTPTNNPPTYVMYKWSLPGALSLTTPESAGRSSSNKYVITDATRYFRNLGVVRNSTTVNSVGVANYVSGTTAEPINGFLQFHNSSDPMQLIYVRDHATGYAATSSAGSPYNKISEIDPVNYQYVTSSVDTYEISTTVTETTTTSTTFDTTELDNADKIFYIDIPKNAQAMFYTSGLRNGNYEEYLWQTTHSDALVSDGVCYTQGSLTNEGSKEYNLTTYTPSITLPALNDPAGRYIRIYFYDQHSWDPLKINVFSSPLPTPAGGYNPSSVEDMTTETTTTQTTTITEDIRCDHLYLNLGASGVASGATVRMYYDTVNNANIFKAYVPTSWLSANSGLIAHYNRVNYYDDALDALRWSMTASGASSGDTYTLLGYSNATNIASLSAGTGVGTWDDVREMRFDTELIDSNIAAAYRYKVSTAAGEYPMIPVDDLCLTFKAWVPESGLSSQSSTPVLSFKRFPAYNNNTASGTWTPGENITDTETTYYAVDAAGGNSNIAHGWFHVAVLTDATFENLIYDTVYGDDSISGATLRYSYDGSSASYAAMPCRIDTRRWVVPMMNTVSGQSVIYDMVYFEWTPYPSTDTVFTYIHYASEGIYCVVTEAGSE